MVVSYREIFKRRLCNQPFIRSKSPQSHQKARVSNKSFDDHENGNADQEKLKASFLFIDKDRLDGSRRTRFV